MGKKKEKVADVQTTEETNKAVETVQTEDGAIRVKNASGRNEIYLIGKDEKTGVIPMIFSSFGFVFLFFLIELALLIWLFYLIEKDDAGTFMTVRSIFVTVMIVYLVNTERMGPEGKITWMILVAIMPVFGCLLFLFTQINIGHIAEENDMEKIILASDHYIKQDPVTFNKLEKDNNGIAGMVKYANAANTMPIYENNYTEFFPLGEDMLESMLKELEKAKKYIYVEFFLINEGHGWGQILDVLARKAAEGVEVRVIYDATVELAKLPHDYPDRLEKLGIQAKAFSPFKIFISTNYNYRNHRKIVVIDGNVAYTGGVNLADEYFNMKVTFGHWKDTAVMIKGKAAESFKLLFLQDWSLDEEQYDFKPLLDNDHPQVFTEEKGYVMPFGEQPFDNYEAAKRIYIEMINRSTKYCYIMTPYLIIDKEMENTMLAAAARGVDIELILPGIPDKKIVYAIARSYYKTLISGGVKIYEYTPGFVHAKEFVTDNNEAFVGTVNLDYRSLFHHFECGLYMYKTNSVKDVYEDYLYTRSKCHKVTLDTVRKKYFVYVFLGKILRCLGTLL